MAELVALVLPSTTLGDGSEKIEVKDAEDVVEGALDVSVVMTADIVSSPVVDDKVTLLEDVVVTKVVPGVPGSVVKVDVLVAPMFVVDAVPTVLDIPSEVPSEVLIVVSIALVNVVLLLVIVICGNEPPGTVHGIGVCVAIGAVGYPDGTKLIVVVRVIVTMIGSGTRLSTSTARVSCNLTRLSSVVVAEQSRGRAASINKKLQESHASHILWPSTMSPLML